MRIKSLLNGYLRLIAAASAMVLVVSVLGSNDRLLVAESVRAADSDFQRAPLPLTVAIDTVLEAKIQEIIRSRPHDRADWGIEVMSLDSGQVVYSHNGNRPLIP